MVREQTGGDMVSEVRKVLRNCVMNCDLYDRLDAAERADAAKREVSFIVECKRCGQSTCTSPEYSAVCGCGTVFKLHRHGQQADVAPREEPVQELRRKVAELVARWSAHYVPIDAAVMVRNILAELNAIIATEPDPVENRQATASGPVMHESVWRGPYNVPPNGEIQLDEHIRAIAADVVRDAMPDVLDGLAETWVRYAVGAEAFRKHAEKLRKERGS